MRNKTCLKQTLELYSSLGGSNDHRSIDSEGVDLPVSIYERLGVLIDDW